MLKETFKMRKIGKHLVNVSMLSLAVVPVVGSVRPVFAEEIVANTEEAVANAIPADISFEGHNVVDKLENTQPGSNSPDADGSYNSQIESISVVSTETNKVRYRVKLKDNFVIPKGGRIHFYLEGKNQFVEAVDLYIGKTKVGVVGPIGFQDPSKTLIDQLKTETTLSGFKDKLNNASTKDVNGVSEWGLTFNDEFSKLNKDRSIEFTVHSYLGPSTLKEFPTLYLDNPSKAELFNGGGSSKKYNTRLILPSIKDKALVGPYNIAQYPLDNTTTKLIDDVKYTSATRYNLTNNPRTSKKLPIYLSDVNYTANITVKSVAGGSLEQTIERNHVTNETLFLKKGDKVSFNLPEGSKRVLDLTTSLKVGDVVNGAKVDTYVRKGEDGPRFTDSSLYEKDKPLTSTSTDVPLKVTKITDTEIEYEIQKDVPLVDNTFSEFDFNNLTGSMSVSLRPDWIDVYGHDHLKTLLTSKASGERLSVKDGYGFNVKLSRDNKALASFNQDLTISKNTNLSFGDLTKGTIKVRYVDTTGAVIKGTDTETVAENKLWYETVTVTPKSIKGYEYVSADAPLSTIAGSGEQIITLTYKQDLTYISDPLSEVGGKTPDPNDPSKVRVGTKPKVVEEEIPFKEEVRENPKLPKGTENVIQEGEKGKKTTTTTYTVDPKTGNVTPTEKVETKDPKNRIIERGTGEDKDGEIVVNYIPDPENEPGKQTIVDEGKKPKLDVTGKVKDPGKPKVIKVGTKPKVVEEDIPFKEEVRENPKLPKGTENVIQEGEKGKKTTTTTYTMDPKTGEVKPTEKVTTKDPKTRIIERGTVEDVDGEIVVTYIPDPENDPGKQTVVDEGKKPKFDVTGKELDPGKPKVIKVGTKPKVVEEDIPFKEEVRENPELPEGERKVVQKGEKGKKVKTTTYTLDEKTGKVKESTTEKVIDPKVQIVEVGTKKPEVSKEEPKVETPTTEAPKVESPTTEAPKSEEPKVETPTTEVPTTEEPKAKETPKQLPKTSEQAKQRNTAIIALLSVVGLGGLATYFGLRKRDEK